MTNKMRSAWQIFPTVCALITALSLFNDSSLITAQPLTGPNSSLSAQLVYPDAVNLTAAGSGIILETASAGQYYRQNSTLAALDKKVLKAQLNALESRLQYHKLLLSETDYDMKRAQELYDGTMLSQRELKKTEVALLKVRADLQSVEAAIVEARWQLANLNLKAPYNGFVVAAHTYQGKYVVHDYQPETLFKFVADNSILIRLSLPVAGDNVPAFQTADRLLINNTWHAVLIQAQQQDNQWHLLAELMIAKQPSDSRVPGHNTRVDIQLIDKQ